MLVCNLWLFRTWLSDDYEGSTGFQRSCWLKDNGATTPVSTKGAVSGPKNCGLTSDIRVTEIFLIFQSFLDDSPTSDCCGTLKLDGGSMSDLYQKARMGNYRLTHTDGNGRPVYDQVCVVYYVPVSCDNLIL